MSAGGVITIFPGARSGRLEMLGRRGRTLLCRCDCGQFKSLPSNNFRKAQHCGCETERRLESKTFDNQVTVLLTIYRRNAINRSRAFELTRDEFVSLISQPCYYCGAPPGSFIRTKRDKRLGRPGLAYNGIDRESQDLGYVLPNCRPCCSACNFAKGTMTATEYVDHCARVIGWSMFAPRSVFD